ncbi:MAG: hypothetical protein KJ566_02515 [Nanoarchaeota archaeon]|nr:hypothetical protein [Nanoarchaeota archaeon]
MTKIQKAQWIGLIPFIILIFLLVILWLITGFNQAIFYALALVIVSAVYISTHLFFNNLFEKGEENIKRYDEEILILEKEEASLCYNWFNFFNFREFNL